MHLVCLWIGATYIARNHETKKRLLIKSGRGIYPSILEYLQGILCFTILASQLYFKFYSHTMIFILNPCHFVTFLLGIVSLLPFNRFTDFLMSWALGSCFGAWIGIAFAEN